MTSLTDSEIQIIKFGVYFIAVVGVFGALYASNPIPDITYGGDTETGISTSPTSSSWISGLISALPAPLDDVNLLIVSAIFVSPIAVMLGFVALRYIKDIVTQWV